MGSSWGVRVQGCAVFRGEGRGGSAVTRAALCPGTSGHGGRLGAQEGGEGCRGGFPFHGGCALNHMDGLTMQTHFIQGKDSCPHRGDPAPSQSRRCDRHPFLCLTPLRYLDGGLVFIYSFSSLPRNHLIPYWSHDSCVSVPGSSSLATRMTPSAPGATGSFKSLMLLSLKSSGNPSERLSATMSSPMAQTCQPLKVT